MSYGSELDILRQEREQREAQGLPARITPESQPERFTETEARLFFAGMCCYQTAYGTVTETSTVGRETYCQKPSDPESDFGYCAEHKIPEQERIRYFVAYGLAGYGPDGSDGFTCAETWRNLADVINDELTRSAEQEYMSADALGDTGDYEDAWKTHKRSEELANLAQNFDNKREGAPLYCHDPASWEATIKRMVADTFPLDVSDNTRLYVWPSEDDEIWEDHARGDD